MRLHLLKERMIKQKTKIKILIPFLFTFANVFFGFFSVIQTIEYNFKAAAFFILCSALMDTLDGHIARYLKTEGQLGAELDSLSDAVSFCLAPAILLHSWHTYHFGYTNIAMMAVVFYMCAGIFRLARFNVKKANTNHFFAGLPTTVAAGFFAFLVLSWQQFSQNMLISFVLLIAFLMLSSLQFLSFNKVVSIFKKSSPVVLWGVGITIVIGFYNNYPIFLIVGGTYIVVNIFMNIFIYGKKIIDIKNK